MTPLGWLGRKTSTQTNKPWQFHLIVQETRKTWLLTQLCRVDSSTSLIGQVHFQKQGVWLVFIISIFIEISVLNANNVDPDQTPCYTVSDLGLYCLPMSLLWDNRQKLVKHMKTNLCNKNVARSNKRIKKLIQNRKNHSFYIEMFTPVSPVFTKYYGGIWETHYIDLFITNTCLFKYIENFTSKN